MEALLGSNRPRRVVSQGSREHHPLRTVVATVDPSVGRVIGAALGQLRIPGEAAPVAELKGRAGRAGVACVDSGAFATVGPLPCPTVIVTKGAPVPDDVWPALLDAAPVAIRLADLQPSSLLAAILRAKAHVALDDLPPALARIPRPMVEAFLADPASLRTVGDAGSAMGMSSRSVRATVRAAGFPRFERCLVWLRVETWRWLAGHVDRPTLEACLGVTDRSDFRRACRRAGVPVPWSRTAVDTNGPPNGTNGL